MAITAEVTNSGNVTSTSITVTLPTYTLTDTLLVAFSSNQAPTYTFPGTVTATRIANAASRVNVFLVAPSSTGLTSLVVTSSTNAVHSWAVIKVQGADATATIANVGTNVSDSTGPITVGTASLGYISTGEEYAISVSGVNATATWTTGAETLFNTTSGNAAMMINGYSVGADKLSYVFPSTNRGLSGTTRNESAAGIVLQTANHGLVNLVENGSFEGNTSVASGWESEGNTASAVEYTSSTTGVSDGTKAQSMTYAGQAGDTGKFFAVYQAPIDAAPGDTFEFSVDVSGSKSNCHMIVGIEDFKAGGVYISESDTGVTTLTGTPTTYTVQHTCAADTVYVAVYIQVNEIYSTSSVTAYLDRAILKQVTVDATTGVKVYTGSEWELKPVKVYTGSEWVTKPLKRWDGSDWVGV